MRIWASTGNGSLQGTCSDGKNHWEASGGLGLFSQSLEGTRKHALHRRSGKRDSKDPQSSKQMTAVLFLRLLVNPNMLDYWKQSHRLR